MKCLLCQSILLGTQREERLTLMMTILNWMTAAAAGTSQFNLLLLYLKGPKVEY